MLKIDVSAITPPQGSSYPEPYDEPCRERSRRRLGDVAGLSQFGVNLLTLAPGAWSSQRCWQSHEDELVDVVEGEVVLVTDAGEPVLRAGECAGVRVGEPNGHHFQNRSDHPAFVLEVGSQQPETDVTEYPDIDLRWTPKGRLTRTERHAYDPCTRHP